MRDRVPGLIEGDVRCSRVGDPHSIGWEISLSIEDG
jgi:hypothetical protein